MKTKLAIGTISIAIVSILLGCSGDTAGGSYPGQTQEGDNFSPNDSNSGTISVDLNESQLSVGDVTGFRAVATNSTGGGLTNASLVCDTERGLALIEPSTGREITDESGQFSGKVGCEAAGSFRIGCRLSSGTRRTFDTVVCDGSVPNGFVGFPNAGGRGLGLGGGVGDDGKPDGSSGSISIVSLTFSESNLENTTDIDTARFGDCDGEPDSKDPEPYSDTFITVKIKNNSARTYQFSSFRFSVPGGTPGGGTYTSSDIALTGDAFEVASNGDEGTFTSRVFYQKGAPASLGSGYIAGKAFVGSSVDLHDLGLGVKNIKVTLIGVDSEGNEVTVSGTRNLHFFNVDRCGAA